MKRFIIFLLIAAISPLSFAEKDISVYLGAWSAHIYSGNGSYDFNQKHDLIGISYKNITVAKFENSFHRESYFVGMNFDVYENKYLEFKVSVGGVYGYDKCPPVKEDRVIHDNTESRWCSALFGEITPKIDFPVKPSLLLFGTVPAISFKYEF